MVLPYPGAKRTSYYDILGLNPDADKKQIKSSFRKLALKYHPDKNDTSPESGSVFIIINNAYQILINDKTRMINCIEEICKYI
ncbi:MAG: J domain-containing protein [Spirochaetales bacterium]|nr:J domain-containing protein [Spirochaetales bacterium]